MSVFDQNSHTTGVIPPPKKTTAPPSAAILGVIRHQKHPPHTCKNSWLSRQELGAKWSPFTKPPTGWIRYNPPKIGTFSKEPQVVGGGGWVLSMIFPDLKKGVIWRSSRSCSWGVRIWVQINEHPPEGTITYRGDLLALLSRFFFRLSRLVGICSCNLEVTKLPWVFFTSLDFNDKTEIRCSSLRNFSHWKTAILSKGILRGKCHFNWLLRTTLTFLRQFARTT